MKILKEINYIISEIIAEKFINRPAIYGLYFHKIYLSKKDVTSNYGSISEGITVEDFEKIIKYFITRNFIFITQDDLLLKNLNVNKNYIHLSFDDGYYNNFYALSVLKKYNIKATFFISTKNIENNKAFWWDIVVKRRSEQNSSIESLDSEFKFLYGLKFDEQDSYIIKEFGEDAFYNAADQMRPMSEKEFSLFSKHKNVVIGNHTSHHLNLLLYNEIEIIESSINSNSFLNKYSENEVLSIAYPFGFYNYKTLEILKNIGFQLGYTTNIGLDFSEEIDLFKIKRNQLSGFFDIESQCRNLYVNFSLKKFLNFKKLNNGI
jgi:peptidoglycan/xylan/chitin deacetylase (PgdA/CDA1 family)